MEKYIKFGIMTIVAAMALTIGVTIAKADGGGFSNWMVTFAGSVPAQAQNVERASGRFTNTIGLGTEAFLAEPGGFTQGNCDIDVYNASSGFGHCAGTANSGQLFGSGPHDDWVGGQFQVPVGGWAYVSVQEGNFWFETCSFGPDGHPEMIDVFVPQIEGMNTIFMVRGCYPKADGSNRNRFIRFEHVRAASQWFAQIRPPRGSGNTAFISEGWAKQQFATSHTGGTNCGQGCDILLLVFVDLNTHAVGAWSQQGLDGQFQLIYKNY